MEAVADAGIVSIFPQDFPPLIKGIEGMCTQSCSVEQPTANKPVIAARWLKKDCAKTPQMLPTPAYYVYLYILEL